MGLTDKLSSMLEPKRYTMSKEEELVYLCSVLDAKGVLPAGPDPTNAINKMINELRPEFREFQKLHPKYDIKKTKAEFKKHFVGK
jgi:hypothetical protein